jgi:hypothetical protein
VSQEYSAQKLYVYVPLKQADEDFWLKMGKPRWMLPKNWPGRGKIEYFYDKNPETAQTIRHGILIRRKISTWSTSTTALAPPTTRREPYSWMPMQPKGS